MKKSIIELVGVYQVNENPDVSLIELIINKKANEFDVGDFTQEVIGQDRSDWQAPFDEKYLDTDGLKVIADSFEKTKILSDYTRLTFFMYFVDIKKPLLTPFGPLDLGEKITVPARLENIIRYEDPEY